MDPEKRRLIQSMGGRACPAEARPFSRDRKLAVAAARLGGVAAKAARRAKKAAADGVVVEVG